MKRKLIGLALLVALAPELCAAVAMWGCAPAGQRGNAVVLVDRGAGSYVKFGAQRVTAEVTTKGTEQRWSWGANSVVLIDEKTARYYEGEAVKGEFKCRRLGGD